MTPYADMIRALTQLQQEMVDPGYVRELEELVKSYEQQLTDLSKYLEVLSDG